MMLSKYAGKTVLALGAHPDDVELGVGGTVALLRKLDAKVVIAIVSIPSNRENRIKEARQAAALLSAEVRFLNPDREMRVEDIKTYELIESIDNLVSELQPALVLSHGQANLHKDHVLVYNAVLAAQRRSFFDLFCYNPTSTRPIPVAFHPRAYVDISDFVDTKLEAIGIHSSQFGCRGLGTEFYRDACRTYGRLAGVAYAEGLEVVRLKLN